MGCSSSTARSAKGECIPPLATQRSTRTCGRAKSPVARAGGSSATIGYARVSTIDQDPALQLDALTSAGCTRVFEDYVRDGDVLIVWKLDRLRREMTLSMASP